MFNPLATFVAGQPAALLLFSGSLLWLWASPRTHRWRSFCFVCEKTSLERGTFAGLLQVQSQACANLACTLDEQSCWGSYSCLFTTCIWTCLGWGKCQNMVKWHPNIIQTIQCSYIGFLSMCCPKSQVTIAHYPPQEVAPSEDQDCASSWSKLYRF